MDEKKSLWIDGREVAIEGERNLLEVIRKAGIDIPTFCYHSELSIYGACRLCLVEIEGRGLVASCSIPPEPGIKVLTNTPNIRKIRRVNVELLLANHDQNCTTCPKTGSCQLQSLAKRMGIEKVRFHSTHPAGEKDCSSLALVRDPGKCVLCGDCVRFCSEVQSVGALDFAFRGSKAKVVPAFGKNLADVECINCGQCARVCPTGALVPRSEIEEVWKALDNPEKTVVVQMAPATRVSVGEYFGMEGGSITTGQIVAALKKLGFDKIYDTSFTADLTVIEEASEFIVRKTKGEKLPQFTSCCPGWVKFAEQYFPELLPNLSTCRSPQQMFGSLAKAVLPEMLKVDRKNLVVVSLMPCTAKKFEARRPEFVVNGEADVDFVLTAQELGRMVEQAGIRFKELKPESLDMPFGFKTGAGVIFGSSGGVTEAVLRFVSEKVTGVKLDSVDFLETRGEEGIREVEIALGDEKVKIAIVYGLANARKVAEAAKKGESPYALIEVMACPGGCVNGAGQPVTYNRETIRRRAESLYEVDKSLQLHKSQDNPYIVDTYKKFLGDVGGEKAHHLLHTHYYSRKRINDEGMVLVEGGENKKVEIGVCVGTNCYVKGSQDILRNLFHHIESRGLEDYVEAKAAFCFENCKSAPVVRVGDTLINDCTFEKACRALDAELARCGVTACKAE